MRRVLIVTQSSLCTMLLVGAALFIRTFVNLSASDVGFNPYNVLTARASLQGPSYQDAAQVALLYQRTVEELESLPGVEAAAVTNNLPVDRGLNLVLTLVADIAIEPAAIDWRYVTPDYLRVLDIPLVSGRSFSSADTRNGTPVAMVNEAFVRQFGAAREVIGTHLQLLEYRPELADAPRQIVGVIGDVRTRGVSQTRPTMFVPVAQVPSDLLGVAHSYFQVNWALRTQDGVRGLNLAIDDILRRADPQFPLTAFRTMDEVISGQLTGPSFQALLLTLFAVGALVLAATGLYGLVSHMVSQQTRDIGIRLALGASSQQVVASFSRQAIWLAGARGLTGLPGAALLTRLLRQFLFAIEPLDPVAMVAVVLGLVCFAATWIPARRATRIDPMVALRAE